MVGNYGGVGVLPEIVTPVWEPMMDKFREQDELYFDNYTYLRDNTTDSVDHPFRFKLEFKCSEMRIYKWGCAATSWNPNTNRVKFELPAVGG